MGFPYLQRRSELVSNIMRMAQTFGLRQEVAHDAILLMDRAMSTSLQVRCTKETCTVTDQKCRDTSISILPSKSSTTGVLLKLCISSKDWATIVNRTKPFSCVFV